MGRETEHRGKVDAYYNESQPFYKYFWHWGADGLHYGFWDKWSIINRRQAITRENEVLAEMAMIRPGDLVLDAGAGVGGSGIWLAKNKGARVIALDVVHKQLTAGKKLADKKGVPGFTKEHPGVGFVEGSYQELPISPEVDVYWSLESIEHTTDVDKLVKEAFNVLRPGGRMIVAATFKGEKAPTPKKQHQLEVGHLTAGTFNDFRSAADVARSMEATGFRFISNQNVTPLVMRSAHIMARMCKLSLPAAKLSERLGITSRTMSMNTEWGTYQEELFKSGATTYNILLAHKPMLPTHH